MRIEKLLILIDLSEISLPLLRYGVKLAEHLQARVWVQYVYQITTHITGDTYFAPAMLENYEQEVSRDFDSIVSQVSGLDKAAFVISRGDFLTEVNHLIDKEKMDLVLIGNRGKGFLTNIMGSNANKIIQHAHCPVLSLPQEKDFEPINKLAFAIDLQETSQEVIDFVKSFAKAFSARIDIIHVSKAPVAVDVRHILQTLDANLEGIQHQFFHIKNAEIEEALERHMVSNNVDLLVLLPRAHSFFDRLFQKSISRQAAYQKKMPLLTIHQ
ncbi:MAG: universal stress protein [Cyclobacteriaceae bacterium]